MDLLKDLAGIVIDCVGMLRTDAPSAFRYTLIIGFLLAACCWIVCSCYSRLWNKQFRITLMHHILCGAASICTLILVLVFSGLRFVPQIVDRLIDNWQGTILKDNVWRKSTFLKAYDEVSSLGIEDFRECSPYRCIPVAKKESRRIAATVFAMQAVHHFQNVHPYLGILLRARSEIPVKVIDDDIDNFFAARPNLRTYEGGADNAVVLAAAHIRNVLQERLPPLIPKSRAVTAAFFLFVQIIPFGLTGLSAYRDLKATV